MRMSAALWHQNPVVMERLLQAPERFELLQALRLLEVGGSPLGGFGAPGQEAVRFEQEVSFGYRGSEIQSIDYQGAGPALVRTAFMGLAGADGTLPFHYTEQLLARLKAKDSAFKDWLDIFHHRALSLYYRASTWARPPSHLADGDSPHRRALDALAGGPGHSPTLASYRTKPAISIAGEASARFGVPVRLRDFIGRWEPIAPDFRSRLNGTTQLGRNALLGGRAMMLQSGVEVLVGPVPAEKAAQFAPGGSAAGALQRFVKQAAGADAEVSLQLQLTDAPPPCRLARAASPVLGWNTRLGGTARADRNMIKLKAESR